MNILDNPDSNFNLPEGVDAEYVTSQSMNAIWDMCIEPMIEQDQLTDEERGLISIVGMTLKIVAHKAKCYEDIQQGKSDFSHLSRN